MVLFFVSLNGFFLKEFHVHPGSNGFKPINMLTIVSALGYRTHASDGVDHPSGKDAASGLNGKTGRFIGAFGQKTNLPEPFCATAQRLLPSASGRTAC